MDRYKLLIVESSPAYLKFLCDLAKQINGEFEFRIFTTELISRADDLIDGYECDCMLLDLDLSDSEIYEAVEWLGHLRRRIPVVVINVSDADLFCQLNSWSCLSLTKDCSSAMIKSSLYWMAEVCSRMQKRREVKDLTDSALQRLGI